jgi:hypothetical protein
MIIGESSDTRRPLVMVKKWDENLRALALNERVGSSQLKANSSQLKTNSSQLKK